jgi:hypothetical protein
MTLLLATVAAAALATLAGAQLAPSERAALVALYSATNGPSWNNVPGWANHLSGSDPCNDAWLGVTCSGDGLHATDVQLAFNGLSGTLPADISSLSHVS